MSERPDSLCDLCGGAGQVRDGATPRPCPRCEEGQTIAAEAAAWFAYLTPAQPPPFTTLDLEDAARARVKLGEGLREARELLGLTQGQAAEAARVSSGAVSIAETGARAAPRAWVALARLYVTRGAPLRCVEQLANALVTSAALR